MRSQFSSSAGFRVKSISSPYLRGPSECIACSCWCIRTTLAVMASLTSASLSSRSAIAGSRVARPQGALARTVLHSGDVQRHNDPPFWRPYPRKCGLDRGGPCVGVCGVSRALGIH